MLRALWIVLFLSVVAFAQLESNSVTVTASRPSNVPADEVVFLVTVGSGPDASLSDVLAAVQPAGITAAHFSGVQSSTGFSLVTGDFSPVPPGVLPQPRLQWSFRLNVPLARIKETVAALTSLQQSLIQKKSTLTLSFSVLNTQVSQQLQQSQPCSQSDLITDARAKAQKLADTAGMNLGPILGMSGSSVGGSQSPCSLTVKFGLSRY